MTATKKTAAAKKPSAQRTVKTAGDQAVPQTPVGVLFEISELRSAHTAVTGALTHAVIQAATRNVNIHSKTLDGTTRWTLTAAYPEVRDLTKVLETVSSPPTAVDLASAGGLTPSGAYPRSWAMTPADVQYDGVTSHDFTNAQTIAAILTARHFDTLTSTLEAAIPAGYPREDSRGLNALNDAVEAIRPLLVEWAQYGQAKQAVKDAKDALRSVPPEKWPQAITAKRVDSLDALEAEDIALAQPLGEQVKVMIAAVKDVLAAVKGMTKEIEKARGATLPAAGETVKTARAAARVVAVKPTKTAKASAARQRG